MQGFVFNLRRPLFQDPRCAQALAYAVRLRVDATRTLFYGQYERIGSYFRNSELAADGPAERGRAGAARAVSATSCPTEVFTKVYEPPKTDGSGNIRENLREGAARCSRRPAGRSRTAS